MEKLDIQTKTVQRVYIEILGHRTFIEKNPFDNTIVIDTNINDENGVRYLKYIYNCETNKFDQAFATGFSDKEMYLLSQVREMVVQLNNPADERD